MDTGSAEVTPADSRRALIGQRLRAGSLVLACTVGLNGIVDATNRPGGLWPVAWIYAAIFALVVLVQLGSRQRALGAAVVPLAAGAVMLWNALFCSYAAQSPAEAFALVAAPIVITMAAALLLPWGLRPQLAVAAICLLTYVGALSVAGHTAELGSLYAIVTLGGAAAVSCVGAYVVEQHGSLIDGQTARLREMNRVMREAVVKKDEFLASVSHELRTPLNVVLGYIDLLLDHSFGPLEPAQRDILHRITKNASNLSHLINDLIDLSRIEAGRLKVEIERVDLAALFADLSGVMEVLLAGHDVTFSASIAPGCTAVRADPDRLKQIVSNLLVNAVKFTERGSITLRAEPDGDATIALAVADTGIGIPPAAHRAIFEPFRQVHDRSRRTPGAGIGLSISSRLAHLMGGSLAVASEPGRGSRFTLVVPAASEAGGGEAQPLRNAS
jgi:signal transduction histidine kinase